MPNHTLELAPSGRWDAPTARPSVPRYGAFGLAFFDFCGIVKNIGFVRRRRLGVIISPRRSQEQGTYSELDDSSVLSSSSWVRLLLHLPVRIRWPRSALVGDIGFSLEWRRHCQR